MIMEIEEMSSCSDPLPLLSLNHVSILVRSVWELYNYGIGIHLLENESIDPYEIVEARPINPKDNHISFQCTDVGIVKKRLEELGMRYVTAVVEDEGNKVDQVFFHDPDGYMIEICNCEKIPMIPISSCAFKPRGTTFKKGAPNAYKCGFMEKHMMDNLSMEMMNFSF
ncbi:hypothetical protein RJ641_010935 [Dillenia turbinata]|uniref:VOC domain-containing protein n=1 Tax=Dillenia turbinata TaxID=194707 RepID=A0AAN8V3H1_9MAGN